MGNADISHSVSYILVAEAEQIPEDDFYQPLMQEKYFTTTLAVPLSLHV